MKVSFKFGPLQRELEWLEMWDETKHCLIVGMGPGLSSAVVERFASEGLTGGGLAHCPASQLGTLAVGKAGTRALASTLANELAPDNVHVATVTICGKIETNTFFAPERIAQVYWELHSESCRNFRDEVGSREEAK